MRKKIPPIEKTRKCDNIVYCFQVFIVHLSYKYHFSPQSWLCMSKEKRDEKKNNWPLGRVTLLVVFFQSIRSIEHLFFYIKIVKKKLFYEKNSLRFFIWANFFLGKLNTKINDYEEKLRHGRDSHLPTSKHKSSSWKKKNIWKKKQRWKSLIDNCDPLPHIEPFIQKY